MFISVLNSIPLVREYSGQNCAILFLKTAANTLCTGIHLMEEFSHSYKAYVDMYHSSSILHETCILVHQLLIHF